MNPKPQTDLKPAKKTEQRSALHKVLAFGLRKPEARESEPVVSARPDFLRRVRIISGGRSRTYGLPWCSKGALAS